MCNDISIGDFSINPDGWATGKCVFMTNQEKIDYLVKKHKSCYISAILQDELDCAVRFERFEFAALLRDKIKELKK